MENSSEKEFKTQSENSAKTTISDTEPVPANSVKAEQTENETKEIESENLPVLPTEEKAKVSASGGQAATTSADEEEFDFPQSDSRLESDTKPDDVEGFRFSNSSDTANSSADSNPNKADAIMAANTDANEEKNKRNLRQIVPAARSGKIVMGILAAGTVCAICLAAVCTNQASEIENLHAKQSTLQATVTSLNAQLDTANQKLDDANSELEEIKNGKDTLLAKANLAFENKDYSSVLTIADEIHQKYYGTDQDNKAQQLRSNAQAQIDAANTAEQKRKEEEARLKAEEEARGYETGITYDQLARSPEEYEGKKVKFTGKVLQVMKEDGAIAIRLAVNSDYNQVIMAMFKSSLIQGNILEDDIITIYGTSGGEFSYQAVMGNEIYLPLVIVDKIDQ